MTSLAISLAAAVSVLAFGGVEVFYFLPAQIIIAVAAGVQFWRKGWASLSRLTSAALAILIAVPLLQIIPLPESILGVLSPGRIRLAHDFAAAGASIQLAPTVSLQTHETTVALLRLLCYLMTFLLAYQNYQLGEGRRVLTRSLIALGILEACYGLVQYLADWQYIYTYAKPPTMSMASGTYINYNHFAGLLEMVLPFLLVQLWLYPTHVSTSQRSLYWRQILSGPELARWMLRLGLFLVVFLALIFSQSRSGILAGIAGMVVSGALVFPKGSRRITILSSLAIVSLLVVYSAWIGLGPVLNRFQNLRQPVAAEQSRIMIWRDSFMLIQDFPVLGSGLGTFPWVSLHYQTMPVTVRYEHAHNDYLEFAADIGIPAALILFCSLWVLAAGVARKSLLLDRWTEKRLAAACAGSLIALLIHSLTDFNLQIPANALIFSWIAGTATSLASKSRSGNRVTHHN
jgi:O-antigen ligase